MVAELGPGTVLGGVPTPTEIDCIEVTKVYDFCYQQTVENNVCMPLPPLCAGAESASCTLTSSTCRAVSSTPVTSGSNFMNVTFAVSATFTVTLYNASGKEVCTVPRNVKFLNTVTLCVPSGATASCMVASADCMCAVMDHELCCTFVICTLYQSTALVTLLVPAYGFCTPAACAVLPSPACPPIFPTQCT